jgi:hypothetical protein
MIHTDTILVRYQRGNGAVQATETTRSDPWSKLSYHGPDVEMFAHGGVARSFICLARSASAAAAQGGFRR